MLSRFVIAFLSKKQASSNYRAPVTIFSDFELKKRKIFHCFHFFPSICHEVMGPGAIIFVSWMLSFKPVFSTLFFHPHKETHSSLISAIRVVSSAYLRLIFLPAVLIPACNSPSPGFHMMYSAYKLNKQADNIQPCHTLSQFWISQLFHIRL